MSSDWIQIIDAGRNSQDNYNLYIFKQCRISILNTFVGYVFTVERIT